MCRMIAAPLGMPGYRLIGAFLRMAQGQNTLHELNTHTGKLTHGEGWGAAFETEGRLEIYRSVLPCWKDPTIESLADARVFLLHARKASQGAVSLNNTHPFDYTSGTRRWFYCHNGTVRDPLPTLPTLKKTASTDSERMFHLLLPHVNQDRVLEGIRSVYNGLQDFTCLNSFLLGPDVFWAVSRFIENPIYYALSFVETPEGLVVSSETLREFGNDWRPLPNGGALRVDRATGLYDLHSCC
jgi:predicted glutamine amidotransferase